MSPGSWCSSAKPLSWVTLSDLQAYAQHLGQGSLKPASQNRALTAVKSLLSFAQETGYLPFNVGAAVKLRPDRDHLAQRILEESEVARLIDAAPEGRNRVLLKLLYVSGVRVSEVCGLKWCDALARQEGGQITVFGKGGKTRTVLLKPKVWQQLLSIKGEAKAVDPIFRSRKGGGVSTCLKPAASSMPPPKRPAWSRKSPRTGCATPMPATRSTAAPRFTWCKPRSATPRCRLPGAICMPGHRKLQFLPAGLGFGDALHLEESCGCRRCDEKKRGREINDPARCALYGHGFGFDLSRKGVQLRLKPGGLAEIIDNRLRVVTAAPRMTTCSAVPPFGTAH